MNLLARIFNRNEYNRRCYAITQGKYKGDFFVYMNHDDDNFNFLSLPGNQSISVPSPVFKQGLKSKIVEYIEKLPYNVYEICVAQYNETTTKDNINRLKQSAPSSSMDNGKHPEQS